MQDMAHHESLDNGDTDYYKVTPDQETLDKCGPNYNKVMPNHETLDNVAQSPAAVQEMSPHSSLEGSPRGGTQTRHERTAEIEPIDNRDSDHHK